MEIKDSSFFGKKIQLKEYDCFKHYTDLYDSYHSMSRNNFSSSTVSTYGRTFSTA